MIKCDGKGKIRKPRYDPFNNSPTRVKAGGYITINCSGCENCSCEEYKERDMKTILIDKHTRAFKGILEQITECYCHDSLYEEPCVWCLSIAAIREDMPEKEGRCCSCNYSGEEITPCIMREDKTHCNHWWDGDSVV